MNKINFSIVICTRNRPKDIELCIQSISQQLYHPFEVIVVDSSDNNDTGKIIDCWKTKLRFKFNYVHTKPGLTKQRNVGVKLASGDVIAFFDDDVVLENDYLYNMATFFLKNPNAYGANGYQINYVKENKIITFLRNFFLLTSENDKGKMKRSGFADFLNLDNSFLIRPTNILVGFNMLFRRCVFEHYRFDEKLEGPSLMEDVQFSHEVSKRFSLFRVGNARLSHFRSEAERTNISKSFEMFIYNHYIIFKRDVKISFLDWFFFWHSHIGILVQCFYWTIKDKNISAITGFLRGHKKILKK